MLLNFRIFPGKTVFTAWQTCKDIWQILQNNRGIPWPKTFQSFRSAKEKNKIICKRKRAFRYFLITFLITNFSTCIGGCSLDPPLIVGYILSIQAILKTFYKFQSLSHSFQYTIFYLYESWQQVYEWKKICRNCKENYT